MARALLHLPYATALVLMRRHDATMGREQWDTGSCVAVDPDDAEALVLVRGALCFPWEPKGVDLRHADWLVVLP